MDKKAYDILLFSYYRDAELRGADLILRLINRTDNLDLQEKLSRHLADETEHAWQWTERIRALGGHPIRIEDGYHRHLRRKTGLPSHLLDLLALTYVVEERSGKRYEEHAARPDVDPETLKVLNAVRQDEDWHLTWVGEALKELEKKEGGEKVTAALERYRALEAEAFAEMLVDEEKALREIAGDTKSEQIKQEKGEKG
ncbi:MAG: ferritin-like domain-containing protein [Candidatus Binatia bacterium]